MEAQVKAMRRIVLAAVLVALGIGLAVPAGASAAVTVGSPLTATFGPSNRTCSPACTDMITTLPEPGAQVNSPINGVIVRWRMMGNAGVASFRLRVVHPESAGQYLGVAEGEPEVPTGDGPSVFNARLPISAGDTIGLDIPDGVTWNGNSATVTGAGFVSVQPTLTDTPPAQAPNFSVDNTEEGFNADVEPDADGDGFGDETQDGCPTNGASQAPCPTAPAAPVAKKKCKKKHKKHSAESAKKKCKKKKKSASA